MQSGFDTIIIGGGLGGLTAGASLATMGKKVMLLEQHYIPGGCATTFKRKDYVLEVGLHELDGLFDKDDKQQIFEFLGVDKHVRFLQAKELFRYKSGTTDFVHPHGNQETIDALITRFPDEEKGIRKYVSYLDGVLTEISRYPHSRWKQLLLFPIMPLLYRRIIGSSMQTLGGWLDRHFDNEELKLILQGNLLYYHDDPYSMSMFYFCAAQASYIGGGGYFVRGGSQQLSNYLASVIERRGGQVLLGKRATRIMVEDGKASGVTYQDAFNEHLEPVSVYADRIIANAAVPLVTELLPEPEASKLGGKLANLETACSLTSVYLGFSKTPKALGNRHYSTLLVSDEVQSLADVSPNCHAGWAQRNAIFVDYSQIDSGLAPDGKAVGVICTADYLADWEQLDEDSYTAKKAMVAETLINRLDQLIPGIADHIEHVDVGTPRTVQSYILTPEGTAYGFAQIPSQASIRRTPLKSPIPNLFFAGAWTFPGGGFTGAILSGYKCAVWVNETLPRRSRAGAELTSDSRIVPLLDKKLVASDTIELVVEKPKGFHYRAGQYVVLDLVGTHYQEQDMPIRPFSMLSHPDEEVVRFAMRDGHSMYKRSIDALKPGDPLRLFGPIGDFTLRDNGRPIVLLISGIGVTPIPALLKAARAEGNGQHIHLFYSNRTEAAAAYHDQLQAIEDEQFSYVPVFTASQARINAVQLQEALGSLPGYDFYIVGHHDFLSSMEAMLTDNEVPGTQLTIDDFG